MADKNTLKQWFVTGAKPLQAQYWAWLDSYWHKSEPISINNIENLSEILVNKADADQLALYAKKDASNIDVPTWKTKLGVGDLPANVATIDYVSPSGEAMIGNAYKKVEQPNDGKTYLLKIDGTAVDGDTFGKNVSNSYLTSLPNTGLKLGAIWELDSNGFPLRFKNLPDKSTDSTFVDFLGKNNEGQLAKVGYQAFYNAFQGFSAQQSLTLSQLLAGGQGSDGAPNVNLISPPIIQNQYDSVEYVLLRGTNLKLNTTAMSVKILNSQQNIVATIPNNQIQLSDDGLSLVFYYNFHNFPVGTYFIKLVSGSKTYITTLDLKIVESVENINLAAITWDVKYADGVTPGNYVASGSVVQITTPAGKSPTPNVSVKSSELFKEGDDFYLEYQFSISEKNTNLTDDTNSTSVGIGYSNTDNSLTHNSLIYLSALYWRDRRIGIKLNNIPSTEDGFISPMTVNCIIIKTGNLFRLIIGNRTISLTLSNNSGYSMFMGILGRAPNDDGIYPVLTTTLIKAFKFN